MSNFYTSPNMQLTVPVVGVDTGPDWANNINASLTIIDAHTHAPGSGVQITPSGININSDLPFGKTNNATQIRSARFWSQASPIAASGSDLECVYVSGVDLYYNDGSGNQIRITQSGSVAGASGTITGLPSGTASAAYASGTGTFVFQQATSTGANLDVASIAIRYPGSYPTPSGNYIQLQAPSSLASGYSLTLPALPSANNTFLSIATDGTISSTLSVDNSTLAISGGNVIVKSGGITATQMANATITGTQVSSSINLPGKTVQEAGSNVVVSNTNATNSMSIVRASFNGTTAALRAGEGATCVRNSTGVYAITFSTAFGDTPVFSVSCSSSDVCVADASAGSSTSVVVATFIANTLNKVDTNFDLIAIGQRA